MKLSNKILLATGAILLIIFTVFMFRFKAVIGDIIKYEDEDNVANLEEMLDSEKIDKTFDFKDFDELELELNGVVNITGSDNYQVVVTAPRDILESKTLNIDQSSNRLNISSPTILKSKMTEKISIAIEMPDLEELEIDNAARVNISDLQMDFLDIEMTGDCELFAKNSSIQELSLKCFGASNADLANCKVENATIQSFGANSIDINMAGGRLEGSMTGSGVLTYYGTVEDEDIRTLGSTKVIKQ
ncbi:MAG TPA: DUF2807 domain-containing protein [bacterium]|nr:DUF2807 domain-containing protein [bacterium]